MEAVNKLLYLVNGTLHMWFRLKTFWYGDFSGLFSLAQSNHEFLKGGKPFPAAVRRRERSDGRGQFKILVRIWFGPKDGRRDLWAKEHRLSLAGKGKEMDSSLEPPQRNGTPWF